MKGLKSVSVNKDLQKVKVKDPRRILGGHLWVFSNEIMGRLKHYTPGEIVELYDNKNNFLGTGYINPHSLIAVRVLSRKKISSIKDLIYQRIREAYQFRLRLYPGMSVYRVVFSEADFLPGLIVDRYGDILVTQILTAGMERLKELIMTALVELINASCIVMRNDSSYRELEGLPLEKGIVYGSLEENPIIDFNGIRMIVDPLQGQKTGLFLDQRENSEAFSTLVKEGRGLDLFSYAGAWGLRLAKRGAHVIAVDSSRSAIEQARKNALLNSLSERMTFVCEDVFTFLDESVKRKERYDFIVLDPPAFVKSKKTVRQGIKGYKAINANAMAILKRGGFFATSSCSHHVSVKDFLGIIQYAARATNRQVRILEIRHQSRDHPFLISMPETLYLKCVIAQVF